MEPVDGRGYVRPHQHHGAKYGTWLVGLCSGWGIQLSDFLLVSIRHFASLFFLFLIVFAFLLTLFLRWSLAMLSKVALNR